VCGDCGASYRRRTERGKVVWRCATRIEKGKEACTNSSTLDEEWIKKVLSEMVCTDNIYDESIVRNQADNIQVFEEHIEIRYIDGAKLNVSI